MLLSARRRKSEKKQQPAFWGSTRATPRICFVLPYRSKAFAAERVQERLRKLGGERQEAEVAAREIDDLAAQLLCQDLVRLIRHLIVGVTTPYQHDLLSVRCKCREIKLSTWVLPYLMLHPVASIGQGVLIRVLAHRALQDLVIKATEDSAGKLVHGCGNSLLARGLVDPVEKGQPLAHIG